MRDRLVSDIEQEDLRPVVVLMAEDDENDAYLAREAMKADKIVNDLYIAPNGLEALKFMRSEPCELSYWPGMDDERRMPTPKEMPCPDLILLDLTMPIMDGREFLVELNKEDRFHKIPVVVFTSSDAERDATESWELGAAAYVVKPLDLEEFRLVVHKINDFWFSVVRYKARPIRDSLFRESRDDGTT